ncbi:MAG: Trm112 family protein [Myxococcales bacterium]|nr:Trm112 family protein [Myxococcales bacterium]
MENRLSVDPELLEILVCPESRQPLRPATAAELETVNSRVREGSARYRGGEALSDTVVEGLVREDGKVLYIVDDGVPVMLIEESIEL